DTFDLRLIQLRGDGTHDSGGHPVLQIEDVFEVTIETIGPQMSAICGIDKLTRYAQFAAGLAHASFKHIPYPQLPSDLLYIRGAALVSKARVSRYHEQAAKAR